MRRVDGWGPLLGDDGSGYDIGTRGLRAAFAAYDGRGPETLLASLASGFLGVLDLLKVAKHGKGENIYLIRFHYLPPERR